MSIKNTNLVLLGHLNIQNRVLYDTLAKVQGISVTLKSCEDFNMTNKMDNNDVLLIEFSDIEGINNLLEVGMLIIYNIPDDVSEVQLIKMKNLKGVLFKSSSHEHLIKCIEHVSQGGMWLPRQLMVAMLKNLLITTAPSHDILDLLTRREQQILQRLVNGYSNQQIADELFVTESTVKTHVYKLYRKINVRCRREAISLMKQRHKRSDIEQNPNFIANTVLEYT
ncbi:response regulator transcription factor [Vibrio sp. 404]|uniref:Response regulator transcription factor n=1 Tax=Vibrio marinisediminis TaxID=2758441 RepID=A0A7W2FMH2_9VIBR|nr:response regulator transcription factor [Vibrio marinisediminis]MBA5760811.1 response regulator transcription factor [Vibrio marinisediminis]